MTTRLRVGTRRSPLARTQTDVVLRSLTRRWRSVRFVAVPLETSGDRDQDPGGSPDFTDAIDRALLGGEVDLAVHSAKDLPVRLGSGLALAACPHRADPRDALVLRTGSRGPGPLRGARIGSSSRRRRAQLLGWRPDLEVVEIRGNVDTRLGLVKDGTVDGAILAVAGLERLGRAAEIDRVLPATSFLPAPGQGALAVLAREGDATALATASAIDHAPTRRSVTAERAVAAALGADCDVPFGALALGRGPTIRLVAEALSRDGTVRLRARGRAAISRADGLGAEVGRRLIEGGARTLWDR